MEIGGREIHEDGEPAQEAWIGAAAKPAIALWLQIHLRMSAFAVDPHKLEELLNYCLGFAKQTVERHGAFHPFGAVIDSGGSLAAVGAHTGEEHPHGPDVFRFLQGAMRSQFQKREIVAACIATDVNIPPQYQPPFPDGIRVLLECAGYSRYIYLPYRVSSGRAGYGKFISVDVPASICVRDEN